MEPKRLTPGEFCIWLKGFVEISGTTYRPNEYEWKRITEKLNTIDINPIVTYKTDFPVYKPYISHD